VSRERGLVVETVLSYDLKVEQEEVAMSSSHKKASWLDRWWPLLLILFGTTFISALALFSPVQ
jgi:hypothetical protein